MQWIEWIVLPSANNVNVSHNNVNVSHNNMIERTTKISVTYSIVNACTQAVLFVGKHLQTLVHLQYVYV